MTKNEYMQILAQKLRRLPKEDYDKAIAYFEEYFEEAGPENEAQAILDLGTPEDAANELIIDLAVRNTQEPPKTVKRGLSAVWVGILGICAAPIALPIAFSVIVVILALLFSVLAFIFSIFFAAVAVTAGGLVGIFGGCILLFSAFADGVATIGFSLCVLGLGIAFIYGSILLCRWVLRKVSKLLGKVTKGGKKHETSK